MFATEQNGAPMMGYQYAGFQGSPAQKFTNVLTPEQIQKLQQKGDQFSLTVTEEEFLRGVCNHRSADGTHDTLVYDSITGEARCTTCGYVFRPIEADCSPATIQDNVDRIIDILQTIKLMYVDLPAEAAKEYFQIIPLIGKIPKLFEFAAKNMSKHELSMWQYNDKNMGAMKMFNNLQGLFNGGMYNPQMAQPMGMGYQAAPMYNPQMAQPQMGMGYQAAPMGNAFGYPGAQMGYQAAAQNYAYTPDPSQATQPVPVTVPTASAPEAKAAEDVTVTQNVTV